MVIIRDRKVKEILGINNGLMCQLTELVERESSRVVNITPFGGLRRKKRVHGHGHGRSVAGNKRG
jgi:hypothetical protein